MSKNTKLKKAAVKIGTAVGKADRTAHQVAKAGLMAAEELTELMNHLEELKRQLEKSSKRLRKALRRK